MFEDTIETIETEIVEFDFYFEGELLHENARKVILNEKPKNDRIYFSHKGHIEGEPIQIYSLKKCQKCGLKDSLIQRSPHKTFCTNCQCDGYYYDVKKELESTKRKIEQQFIDEENRIKNISEYRD